MVNILGGLSIFLIIVLHLMLFNNEVDIDISLEFRPWATERQMLDGLLCSNLHSQNGVQANSHLAATPTLLYPYSI